MLSCLPSGLSLPPRATGRVLAFAALVVCAGAWLGAQQPAAVDQAPPRFSGGTELIQVDVSVLDGRRQPVRGLTAADFTVLEDGRPRPVEAFTEIDLPTRHQVSEAAWTRSVAPDVVSNQASEQEGRIVIILMDRSIPAGQPTLAARQIALAAIDALGPGDLGAVVSTSGAGAVQNLTSDRARLMAVVNDPGRDWSAMDSRDVAAFEGARDAAFAEMIADLDGDPTKNRPKFTGMTDGRCLCGTCVPLAIKSLAESVSELPRRRKLLLHIGASIEWQTEDDRTACNFHLRDARNAMMQAVDRASLTVHSIDPSGLEARGPTAAGGPPQLYGRVAPGFMARGMRPPPSETDLSLAAQNSLGVLPDRTGGRVVTNSNAPQEHVPAIFAESASYYVLGFVPADRDAARPVRSIEVRVNRPGVRVHARRQYVLPDRAAAVAGPRDEGIAALDSTPLGEALSGLLPVSRVPMGVHVAAFAMPGSPRATVTISADVGEFGPEPGSTGAVGTTVAGSLELVTGAYDPTGRPQASARQWLQLSWPGGQRGRSHRVEALSRVELPPGDYEIRVAAAGAEAARTASVFTHLTVPDYAGAPFSLSHIVFGAGTATSTAPPDFLADVVPVAPTTARVFTRTSDVTAFMQIYQGTMSREPLQPVGVRVRILDAKGDAVRDQALVLESSGFASNRTANVRFTVPVRNLPAGQYLLSLEAAMSERTAGRAVRFEIR
jgi:VWFA-related protein